MWRFTGFYGEPHWEDKHLSWEALRNSYQQPQVPWVVMVDFNKNLFSHEKEGGAPRPMHMLQHFHDVLVECKLEDMGFFGDQFTWRRRRLRERLDRGVCNGELHGLFPNAKVMNAKHSKSDHRLIVLD